MNKNWLNKPSKEIGFGDGWGYSDIILQLLYNRNILSQHSAEAFLNPDYKSLHDPYFFPDMKLVVDRIFEAKEKNEVVFIYTDYDADGIPGGVILYSILKYYGITSEVYTPHREREGYGLNNDAIDYMAGLNAKLVITCDCGISNKVEVEYAKSKGIDIVITDHHTLPEELPEAFGIIHPQVGDYPFKELAGGGVAFKIAQAIARSSYKPVVPETGEALEKWLIDLASISTVGDMMQLVDENRIIVKYGLLVMNKTRRLGLRKLIEVAGIAERELDTYSIGFQIAPRINAAGRMDHANAAINLLISEDEKEANVMALDLNSTNADRQKETEKIIQEAEFQIVESGTEKDMCLFAYNPEWQVGLLGLAAGKLTNKFYRPAFVFTEIDGKLKASARSIAEWNVIEALGKASELFSAFGGHPSAAGLTLKNKEDYPKFKAKMLELASLRLKDLELIPSLEYDAEISLKDVDLKLYQDVEKLKPYGQGNPKPIFLTKNIEVREIRVIGNGEKHLKLAVIDENGVKYKMIGFCLAHFCEVLKIGDKIDVLYELILNEWNGSKSVELKIVDIKKVVCSK